MDTKAPTTALGSRASVLRALGCLAASYLAFLASPVEATASTATVMRGSSQVTCTYSSSTWSWTCTDGAGNYGANEDAEVQLTGPGALRVRSLRTEAPIGDSCIDDYLQVGTTKYCSAVSGDLASVPDDIVLQTSDVLNLIWRTDGSDHYGGFEFTFHFCPEDNPGGPLLYSVETGTCISDVGTGCPSGLTYVGQVACVEDCPVGMYAAPSAISCSPCPNNGLTAGPGATLQSQCVSRMREERVL